MCNEPEETKYKAYLDQRQALIDIEVDASSRLDRGILTLSGGALGLSVTFIEKIAPHPQPWTIWLLGSSWFLLLATLLISLYSHLTSQSAMRRQREILDLELENKCLTKDQMRNSMSTCTHWLNISSMITFTIGVILLCAFTITNLPKGDTTDDREKTGNPRPQSRNNGWCRSTQLSEATTPTKAAITAAEGEIIVTKKSTTDQSPDIKLTEGVVAPKLAKPQPQPEPKKEKQP